MHRNSQPTAFLTALPRRPRGALRRDGAHDMLEHLDWSRVGRSLHLSPRELEVVRHVLLGQKQAVIAQEMHLSLGTVKTYSQRVHDKLGVSTGVELALTVVEAHFR